MIAEILASHRPQDVVIFIVGGTTYEEARSVALYNAANPGVRFFLGGSVVLNSKRYQLGTNLFFCNSYDYLEVDVQGFRKFAVFAQIFSNVDVLQIS